MTIGISLTETMNGWIAFNSTGNKIKEPFSITLTAFSKELFPLEQAREFHGKARIGETSDLPIHGHLTITVSGPAYSFTLEHPQYGSIFIDGKKQYSIKNLLRSLTTCPLSIYKDAKQLGTAEISYTDSMLAFPFKALRLQKENHAFHGLKN